MSFVSSNSKKETLGAYLRSSSSILHPSYFYLSFPILLLSSLPSIHGAPRVGGLSPPCPYAASASITRSNETYSDKMDDKWASNEVAPLTTMEEEQGHKEMSQ
jgi:hypothetical protein